MADAALALLAALDGERQAAAAWPFPSDDEPAPDPMLLVTSEVEELLGVEREAGLLLLLL